MQHYISHFDGIDGLKKEDVPMPSPGPDQVLVQIRAISLNYRDTEGRHHLTQLSTLSHARND